MTSNHGSVKGPTLIFPLEVKTSQTAIIQQKIPYATLKMPERSVHWNIWEWVTQGEWEEVREKYRDRALTRAHCCLRRGEDWGCRCTLWPQQFCVSAQRISEQHIIRLIGADTWGKDPNVEALQLQSNSPHSQAENKGTEPGCLPPHPPSVSGRPQKKTSSSD